MPVIIGKEPGIAASMSESADAGGSLAWRLLATLEGGSLVLAGCALLAYTARGRPAQQARPPVDTVALTNTTNELGKILKARLEAHGCAVNELTNDATSGAGSRQYDALVVVGGSPKDEDLNGITGLVTEDVYNNIQLLENLSSRVHKGGCIAWACAGAIESPGSFGNTTDAFDAVLQASLMHVAKVFQCVPVWVGRGASAERAADSLVAALLNAHTQDTSWFSVRNAAHTVGEYLYRWLKIIT